MNEFHRLLESDNNGQATHGASKPPKERERAWKLVITMVMASYASQTQTALAQVCLWTGVLCKGEAFENTPNTRVGPGFRDWTLAVKSRKTPKNLFIRGFPRSGLKSMSVERRRQYMYAWTNIYLIILFEVNKYLWLNFSEFPFPIPRHHFQLNWQEEDLKLRG